MSARLLLLDIVDIRREIFSRLTISEIWKLTSLSKSIRNQLREFVKEFPVLDFSTVKWKIKDEQLISLLTHFPKVEILNLKGCSKITNKLFQKIRLQNLKEIILEGCDEITTNGISNLVKNCTSLSTLDLRGVAFDVGGVDDATAENIANYTTNMQKLVVWNAKITDKGLDNISIACKNLKVLDLWNSNKITDIGIEHIALNCIQLYELNLSHCLNIGPASLYSIANYCSSLKILSLNKSGNKKIAPIVDGLKYFINGVCDLVSLNIRGFFETREEIFVPLMERLTNLTELNIGGCSYIEDIGVESIARNCTNLTALDMWSLDITDKSLLALSQSCKDLHTIELWTCESITDLAAKYISEGLCAFGLKKLVLRGCELITDQSLIYIGEKCPNLESFSVVSVEVLTDVGVTSICNGCHKLQELELSFLNLLTDESILSITKCPKLKELYISELPKITDHSLEILLPCIPKLEYLSANKCGNLTDSVLKALGKNCRKLSHLDMEYNSKITDSGIEFLSKGCKELVEISLAACNTITAAAMKSLLDNCKGLQELCVSDCELITQEDVQDIEDTYDLEIDF